MQHGHEVMIWSAAIASLIAAPVIDRWPSDDLYRVVVVVFVAIGGVQLSILVVDG